jgi:hypothetical protein
MFMPQMLAMKADKIPNVRITLALVIVDILSLGMRCPHVAHDPRPYADPFFWPVIEGRCLTFASERFLG